MDALELHYGLGYASQIENIIVAWPSRDEETNQQKIVTYDGPFYANQSFRIVEDLGFVGLKGDANNSQSVDILDIMVLINTILSDDIVSPEVYWAMDMNFSESLNVLDVTKLVNFVLFH